MRVSWEKIAVEKSITSSESRKINPMGIYVFRHVYQFNIIKILQLWRSCRASPTSYTNRFHISVLTNDNRVFPVLTAFDVTTRQQLRDTDCLFIGTEKYQARGLTVQAELARPVRGPRAWYFSVPMKTNSQYPVCCLVGSQWK